MANISAIKLPNGDIFDLVDEKVTQNASTSNNPQPILFRNNVSTSTGNSTDWVRYAPAVTITPSTGTINATKFNDYILAGACAKAVDNSISTSSSSNNLPTSAAVASFVEGKGYITSASLPTPLIGTTLNTTPTQVATALAAGRNVEITHTDTTYGDIIAYSFNYAEDAGLITSNAVIKVLGVLMLAKLVGDTNNNTWDFETLRLAQRDDLPTKMSDLTNDSGFVTTDEKLKTNTNYSTDGVEYSLIFGNNTTNAETKYYSEGLRFSEYHVDTVHEAYLKLGKSNLKGILLLHDNTNNVNNYVQIYSDTLTQHQSVMLPNKSGTLALTSDIPPIPLIPTDLSDLNNDLNVSDFPNDAGYINSIKTINNQSLIGSGNISITSGLQNLVDGSATASVRGVGTTAESSSYTMGQYAFAEGYHTKASGSYSHAEGYNTTASGNRSHAEGENTTASGEDSHAEGLQCEAIGDYSHAEGAVSVASSEFSHAEGAGSVASGQASHAEGDGGTASGQASHAQNTMTIAQRKSQTALGEYNVADTSGTTTTRGEYAVIVGNGTATNARSNALTIDWNGNVNIASGAHYKINGSNLSASDVGAQATLISGTNIKTINNQSLLGSGNMSIVASGTSIPTADTVAEFDNDAHMNSTDMTSQEVEDFVDGLNVTASTLVDYIVEQGTSGIWTYRKWNSGIAECWCLYIGSIAVTTASAGYGGYRSDQVDIDFPFTFTQTPSITATIASGSAGAWVNNVGGSSSTKVGFYLSSSQSNAAANRAVSIHVIGRLV